MIDDEVVAELARHWDHGWNGEDVEVIMGSFARDVVFSSPFVPTLTGDPARTTIDGYDAVRSYVVDALRRSGDVRYTLDRTLVGTDSVVLVYTCHLPTGVDKPGADLMRVDADGKVTEWRCHYATDPSRWCP
jgi:ketosteroid isomerase-like protein